MNKVLTLALCLGLTAPVAAFASSDNGYAHLTPDVKNQIRTTLSEQGYEVRKIKMEDGYYEAYALKDGARLEIYLDKDLNIVRSKIDD